MRKNMLTIRKSNDRGHADHGWLNTYHTFSFGGYRDPKHMSFRSLRVLNEDRVKPGHGFPEHEHDNMEIVSYVVSGALEHKDSLGTGSVIRPGDVQRMTAGSGVTHSEFNSSKSDSVHFLQIWLFPEKRGIEPSYEQKNFSLAERTGRLRLVASRDGADGSLRVHQDERLFASILKPGDRVQHELASARHAWVQVIRGSISVNGQDLTAGDGAALSDETLLTIASKGESELLVFDLA